MLNYLKGCTRQTQIGFLPDIINHNNQSVEAEFNYIFDSSLNRLTKSVYAPTGSVKAHFGEFVNLSAEYVTIKNIDSVKDTIKKAVNELAVEFAEDHNVLNNRFADPTIIYSETICHDARSIAYDTEQNVKQSLDSLFLKTDEIGEDLKNITTKVDTFTDQISTAVQMSNDAMVLAKDACEEVGNYTVKIDKALQQSTDAINIANQVQTKLSQCDTSIQNINSSIQNINSSIQNINSSISEIDDYNDIQDVSILKNNSSINSIANCDFQITYNGVTYTVADLMQLIVWKNGLEIQTITYKDELDIIHTINVVCEKMSESIVLIANRMLSQLTGDKTPIENPTEYTDDDINDATNAIDNLIG